MFMRILNTIKKIMEKPSKNTSSEIHDEIHDDALEDTLGDHFFEITLKVRNDGEFVVFTDLQNEGEESAFIAGATLYMLNGGILSEYFLEAMGIKVEKGELSPEFVQEIIEEWTTLINAASQEEINKQVSVPEISPADVFGLRKIR